MPRLSPGSLPAYRRHKASGQAMVTLAGRDHYLGPHGTKASRSEYDRVVSEWIAAGRPSVAASPPSQITIVQLIAAYWHWVEQHYRKDGRPTSEQHCIRSVMRFVKELYGRSPACEFGPRALKAVREKMIERGLSRKVINSMMGRIRRLFRWAASEELLPGSIYQNLSAVDGLRRGKSAARETSPVLPVADATVDLTLPQLSKTVADMVRLQRLTGARPGEVCQLRPCDLDRSGEIWRFTPKTHKTEHHERERIIFLGPKAQEVVLPYLLRPADAPCFSPKESAQQHRDQRSAARVTPATYGNRPGKNRVAKPKRPPRDAFDVPSYRRAIYRGCELAFGMPDDLRAIDPELTGDERTKKLREAAKWRAEHCWSPHQLRHTAATEIRHQYGLEAAQAILGHSRADVTQIYAERNNDLAARVAREVG